MIMNPIKKIIIPAIVIIAVLIGGTCFYLKGRRYEVVITQEQISSKLAQRFPASKEYLLVFNITYTDPQVILLENENRVQVGLTATLNMRINGKPKELKGIASVTTGIRYENATQEFFLDQAEFNRLEIQGIPDKWLKLVTEVASKAAKNYIETKPIYQIKAKDVKTTAAKLLLKEFEVRDQAIYVRLGI
jgi:hypothetical protein